MGRPVIYANDLIIEIAAEQNMTPSAVAAVIRALRNKIIERVAGGQAVVIKGLGRFKRQRLPKRTSKHPRTGKPFEIPSMMIPRFRSGDTFKEAVRANG